jgi:hypothetical protein
VQNMESKISQRKKIKKEITIASYYYPKEIFNPYEVPQTSHLHQFSSSHFINEIFLLLANVQLFQTIMPNHDCDNVQNDFKRFYESFSVNCIYLNG